MPPGSAPPAAPGRHQSPAPVRRLADRRDHPVRSRNRLGHRRQRSAQRIVQFRHRGESAARRSSRSRLPERRTRDDGGGARRVRGSDGGEGPGDRVLLRKGTQRYAKRQVPAPPFRHDSGVHGSLGRATRFGPVWRNGSAPWVNRMWTARLAADSGENCTRRGAGGTRRDHRP